MKLDAIKIGARIALVVAVMGVVMLGLGGIGVLSLDQYQQRVDAMENAAQRALAAERANALVNAVVMEIPRHLHVPRCGGGGQVRPSAVDGVG